MKKRLALALSIVMSVGLLGGCGSSASTTGAEKEASVASSAAETSAVAEGNTGKKKELKWGSVGTQTTLREQAMAKALKKLMPRRKEYTSPDIMTLRWGGPRIL